MQNQDTFSNGIGILGGTFDPIHLGHLEVARAVHKKYGLSAVAIIPAFQNPLRQHEQILAPTEDRLIMAYLASAEEDWLLVDPIEINRGRHRPGPSYAIDTLDFYKSKYPDAPLTLIVGADNVALHKWKDVEQFPDLLTRIVAVSRPGCENIFKADMEEVEKHLPQVARLVEYLPDINLPYSSTSVRESLRKGKVPSNWLHPLVTRHILKYGLYGCREVCEL